MLSTTFAALVGTTTAGAFIESAAGVSVGGRTGMTAVVTAMLFGVSLFFAPTITAIPPQAYGPALMIVGAMMIAPIRKIEFDDDTELIPAFAIISLMSSLTISGRQSPPASCSIHGSKSRQAAGARSVRVCG